MFPHPYGIPYNWLPAHKLCMLILPLYVCAQTHPRSACTTLEWKCAFEHNQTHTYKQHTETLWKNDSIPVQSLIDSVTKLLLRRTGVQAVCASVHVQSVVCGSPKIECVHDARSKACHLSQHRMGYHNVDEDMESSIATCTLSFTKPVNLPPGACASDVPRGCCYGIGNNSDVEDRLMAIEASRAVQCSSLGAGLSCVEFQCSLMLSCMVVGGLWLRNSLHVRLPGFEEDH